MTSEHLACRILSCQNNALRLEVSVDYGLDFPSRFPRTLTKEMVGATGFEPVTSTV